MSDDTGRVVLVADDDPDILDIVVYRLERSGYTVISARDGQEAFDLAVAHQPDLAVVDVMMPKLDGYELTRQLKTHPATESMRVIILTANAQEDDVTRGFEAGADDYIRKPFSPQELRVRVQAVLGRT